MTEIYINSVVDYCLEGDIVPVIKIIELVGASDKSWQEAVDNAIKEAGKTIRNIRGIDVIGWTGKVEGENIVEYRANVKIAFLVETVRE